MRQGASDTAPEVQRVHGELLRQASPARRLRLAFSLSRSVMSLARAGIARRLPGGGSEAVGLRFIALHYGAELAEDVRRDLDARRQ